jgi:hypothetical protein
MEYIFKTLLTVHIIAGSISLILFWIPAFTKKGNDLHKKSGFWYMVMMWIVVGSALILSIKNAFLGQINTALFLGFISLITANPLWYGIAVLKNKKQLSTTYLWTHRLISIIIVLFGMFLVIYGTFFITSGIRYLMWFFGALGIAGIVEIVRSYRDYENQPHWFKRHYTGMISSGIAAYTAFFAFGGRTMLGEILTNELQLIPWIAPTFIGVTAMRLLDRKYKKVISAKSVVK